MVRRSKSSFFTIGLLILAGEAAFLLPFVLPRIFRPTVLEAFELDNVQLGQCFSVYGFVALVSYFFGGPLADRFAPRKLMAIALVTTSLGGFVAATYPSFIVMQIVYGYWGFTTIFLFWAAMLKATRQWGGDTNQGRAFGFLDGGRGLVSATIGSLGVAIFSATMGSIDGGIDIEQRRAAFRSVILFNSILVALVGILVWLFLRTEEVDSGSAEPAHEPVTPTVVWHVLQLPTIWLLMAIVLCGYVGFKVTDDLTLYAKEVMFFNEVDSARLGTLLLYLRPVVGVVVGLMADRTRPATWIVTGFALMLVGAIVVGAGVIDRGSYVVFYSTMFATCIGVFAIRSLYFASMQEGKIPLHLTGTSVGLISVVGFTPDIFMGPVMGHLLDSSPGEPGHQYLFWLLAGFSAIGLIASAVFRCISGTATD
ncbi:MAG: MFS transporter [Planctomycetales bacterium]|nr:MFS transporter [Planctomycetales bacterium]